jgi:hypothetical protein
MFEVFLQNMCRNLKFVAAEKNRFKKKQLLQSAVFAPGTQTCATELKEYSKYSRLMRTSGAEK